MPQNLHRPVDLARVHGLSAQAVRNYEAAGILPAAGRTAHGYRTYTPLHAQALAAFVALIPGHGHGTATAIMRAVNRAEPDEALRLVDSSHAELVGDRRTLDAVEAAVRRLEPVPEEGGDLFVGSLARRLGLRPATLRAWERAGVLRPGRDPRTGYRVYGPTAVRDARLAHQLRRGGYPLAEIAPVLDQVRSAGGVVPLEGLLRDWRARLTARSRALLRGAAALDAYLDGRAAAESGLAESGVAGSGVAGSGVAGSGVAGSGVAGSGVAGSGVATGGVGGPATGAHPPA